MVWNNLFRSLLVLSLPALAADYDWYEGTMAADDGATRDYYNREARLPWRGTMGDWRDADNTAQGGNPYGSAPLTNAGAEHWVELDATLLVRQWLDGTHVNKGMLLRLVSGSTTHRFRSREYPDQAQHPHLVVEQEGEVRTPAPVADTYLDQSTYQGFGDAEELRIAGGCVILLRFDLDDLDRARPVTSATLRLYDFRQYSGTAELGLFRCDHGHEQPPSEPRMGLAAGYPGDSGMQSDPDVYFFTSFESAGWQDEWTSVSHTQNYTRLETDAAGGFEPFQGSAVRARLVRGDNYGGSIIYQFADETGSEPEEVYWRYYLRLAESWNPTVSGGKLPGISGTYGVAGWGGRPVHGDDGWSARGNFGVRLSAGNPLGAKNPVGYYCYHLDMSGNYGSTWRWPIGYRGYLENNRWYCIEQYVKMNTPGEADGVLRGWVDGRLAFERTDLRFRTVEALKVEQIWMNLYHGGSAVSPEDMDQYYDNVVIAREYIGPVASSTQARGTALRPSSARVGISTRGKTVHLRLRQPDAVEAGDLELRLHDAAGRLLLRRRVRFDRAEVIVHHGTALPPVCFYSVRGDGVSARGALLALEE